MAKQLSSGDAAENQLWVLALVVLALASVLFFFRLGDRSLGSPEGRWAEITREMQLSGNYFWPTINGRVYYDKPLLSYWLVAVSSHVTGGLNEASARLPSVLGGLLGVGMLMLLARRLYDVRTGIVAAFILATSFSYVGYARLATADMETVAGIVVALTLFVYHEDQPDGWWVVGFWLVMAVTSLTKGLLGFVLPVLVICCYSLLAHGTPGLRTHLLQGPVIGRLKALVTKVSWLLNWKTLLAALIAGLVYCLPFAISYTRVHSNAGLYLVFQENVVRFFEPFDHRDPVYLYAYWIFVLMAPWSVFLPGALVQLHSKARDRSDRFVLVYFWATFIFFTLSGSRRGYYLLPILPAAALLVARLFATPKEALDRRARKLMHLSFLFLGLLVLSAGAAALFSPMLRLDGLRGLPPIPAPRVFAAVLVAMMGTVVYALADMRPGRVLFCSSMVAYLGLLFLFVLALPAVEGYRGEKRFAQAVRRELNGDMDRLLLYKIWGPALLFYLDAPKPVSIYIGAASLAQVIEDNPGRWIVVKEPDIQSLPAGSSVTLASQYFSWGKSPHVLDEYVLLRPKSNAEDNDRSVSDPSHRKAAREKVKGWRGGETVPGKGNQAPAA